MTVSFVLTNIAHIFDSIAVIIITIGGLKAVIHYGKSLFLAEKKITSEYIRFELGRNIVLGIEFLLAADIIETIITPDYYEIGILASLVLIRSVLTYFLNKDLATLTFHK